MTWEIWNSVLEIVSYHYFIQKQQFELPLDTYEHWSAFVVEQGDFSYAIDSQTGEAGAGSIVLCPPDTPFGRITEQPITFHFFLFEWRQADGRGLPFHEYPKKVKWTFHDYNRLKSTLSLLQSIPPSSSVPLKYWQNHLLSDILRLFLVEQSNAALSARQPSNTDQLMLQARMDIEQDYCQPCLVQEVAQTYGLSPVQFSRRFKRAFGINPSDMATQLRLHRAVHLLTHTNQTLEEIAIGCGYNNGFYLSRVFSNKMKMSPSDYRRRHRV